MLILNVTPAYEELKHNRNYQDKCIEKDLTHTNIAFNVLMDLWQQVYIKCFGIIATGWDSSFWLRIVCVC